MKFEPLYAIDKSGKVKVWTVAVTGNCITVSHGKLDGKMQTKLTHTEPKNVGRANETTAEQQAILEGLSKWRKQFDKKYRPTIEDAHEAASETLLPMLAHDYTKVGHRINYPCHVSPKLDGLRCIAEVNESQTEVTFHSRGGKTYPVPEHLKKDILTISVETGIMIFDGELYIHGMSLQNITSCVKKHNEDTKNLTYQIFDIPSDKDWIDRYKDVVDAFAEGADSVEVVGNMLVLNEEQARMMMDSYLKGGYEGLMLRNLNGKYEWGNRSGDLQKWKDFKDLEALVLDVEEDKNGEGVLLCEMQSGVTFKCKMRGTHVERIMAEQVKNIGKWVTVRYQALTDSGAPQFPVGVGIRACDSKGNPLE